MSDQTVGSDNQPQSVLAFNHTPDPTIQARSPTENANLRRHTLLIAGVPWLRLSRDTNPASENASTPNERRT